MLVHQEVSCHFNVVFLKTSAPVSSFQNRRLACEGNTLIKTPNTKTVYTRYIGQGMYDNNIHTRYFGLGMYDNNIHNLYFGLGMYDNNIYTRYIGLGMYNNNIYTRYIGLGMYNNNIYTRYIGLGMYDNNIHNRYFGLGMYDNNIYTRPRPLSRGAGLSLHSATRYQVVRVIGNAPIFTASRVSFASCCLIRHYDCCKRGKYLFCRAIVAASLRLE
ncbi:hypothetical protein LSAT2_001712 [Lamellibrachia satsuma]|nr:hypothetical protein LSAT2_001712 [Lamellibrachia satsuma]